MMNKVWQLGDSNVNIPFVDCASTATLYTYLITNKFLQKTLWIKSVVNP